MDLTSKRNEFENRIKYNISNNKFEFDSIYQKLLEYLKALDFESLKTNKITKSNYKSKKTTSYDIDLKISDAQMAKIESYIKKLSDPKYNRFFNELKIPNRTTKPNTSNLNEEESKKVLQEYNTIKNEEESDIKLRVFINELVNQYLIYHDHKIRRYFINLCSYILLSYGKSHPLEVATMHFRFKSFKGLFTKLAKYIVLESHFERNPETGDDILKYTEISDAFGAKLVIEKGYNPSSSNDIETQKLIDEKKEKSSILSKFELFSERIDSHILGECEPLTYREYLTNCIQILEELINNTHKNETHLIELLQNKIATINEKMQSLEVTSSLDDPITDLDLFEDNRFNYKDFFTKYSQNINTPLTMKGLKKGLNKIFNFPGNTNQEILEKSILDAFKINVFKHEEKFTPSGHEGIHIDILTPNGKFELQAQTEPQYVSDQIGATNAHSLMNPLKNVPLFKIPTSLKTLPNTDTISNYINTTDWNGDTVYFRQDEVSEFISKVECITAHKGRITYNRALNNAKVELYSSLYNYFSLAMELPDDNPKKKGIVEYFYKLSEKSGSIKKIIFHHPDPILRHLNMSEIKNYIFSIRNSSSSKDEIENTSIK